jgi:hypothetical protein
MLYDFIGKFQTFRGKYQRLIYSIEEEEFHRLKENMKETLQKLWDDAKAKMK